MTPDDALTKIREIALALPGTAEKLSHGTPGFQVGDSRFFAYFRSDHHGDGETAVCVKTGGVEEQAMLIEHDPETYFRPAYLGPASWVAMRLDRDDTDWDRVADRIATSWEMVAPARLLEAGGR